MAAACALAELYNIPCVRGGGRYVVVRATGFRRPPCEAMAPMAAIGRIEINIDRTFTRDFPHDTHAEAIVRAIDAVAETLGADTVVEGIELPEVRDTLLDFSCVYGQDYFYNFPLAEEDFRWLLRQLPPFPSERLE